MRVSRCSKLAFLSMLLAGAAASSAAWADHFHHHGPRFGVYIGPSVGWVWYDAPPSYYYYPYPPVVAAPAAPPAYIEQGQPSAQPSVSAQAPSNYWYYCSKPDGYYPYIKQCPGGWQRVAPQPPSQP